MEHKNDKDIEKLFEAAQKIEMPEVAKRHIKLSILESVPIKAVKSPYVFQFRFIATFMLIIILFAGGGVSYAAEKTIPGDMLYPIKTKVNERIAGLLAFSKPAKTDWQGRLALRRLAEVERIAERRNMSVEEVLETHFAKQAERFAYQLEQIRESGETENLKRLESKFALAIAKHQSVIEKVERAMEKPEKTTNVLDRLAVLRKGGNTVEMSSSPTTDLYPAVMAVALEEESSQKDFLKQFTVELDIKEQYRATDVLDLTVFLANNTKNEKIITFNNGCQEFEVLINEYMRRTEPEILCTLAIVEIPVASGEIYKHQMTVDLNNYRTKIGENMLTLTFPWGVSETFSFEIIE